MSVFNIGINDVSDQDRAIKDKLASKDGHISALQTQLSRQTEEMRELKEMYNENLRQLAGQTTRVVELENDIKARSNLLSNEKMAFQNADKSLVAANSTIKQRDLDVRDLEVKLDQLSRLSDEHKYRADKLVQDKATLEARVRELNTTFNQSTMPPTTPGRPPSGHSRSRSPSPSRNKIMALEQQLNELRAVAQQSEADAILANEKASRAHDEQIRVGNEKTALERRMTRELTELKAALEEKEDEMREHTMAADEVAQREKELVDRIDEDEARHQAIVKAFQGDLAKAEEKANSLELRVSKAEVRQIELVAEKEEALEELDKARQKYVSSEPCYRHANLSVTLRTNSQTTANIDDETAQNIARILAATKRLRSERDALRVERDDLRSRLDFLQAESKFALEALNTKLEAGSAEDLAQLRTEFRILSDRHRIYVARKDAEIRHLSLAMMASAVVIQRLDSEAAISALHASDAHTSHNEIQEQLSQSQSELSDLSHKLQQAESNIAIDVDYLEQNSREIDELRVQLEVKDSELEQTFADVKTAEEAQEFYRKQYDDAESQRSSLALEVTNLTNELSVAMEDLKAAENRYAELQFHQFEAMSKTDGMRMLQNELGEERARVKRRDDHLNMLQHDIGRMETTLVLQEDRLGEMTTELEAMAAAKDAMVDDCADARDARDSALSRLEQMEMAMETRMEDGDRAIETLVRIVFETVGNAREGLRVERGRAHLAERALTSWEYEHQILAEEKNAESAAMEEAGAEVLRQSTIALAVSQLGLDKALCRIRGVMTEKQKLQQEVMARRDDMDRDSMLSESLSQQLEALQCRAAAATLDFSNQTSELRQHIQDLQQTISDNQAKHAAATEELARSKEQLSATLQETQRALAQSSSDDDINCIREQYATQLTETRAQVFELEELRASHAVMKDELQKASEDAKNAREELETAIAESLQNVDVATQRQDEISRLRDELVNAQSEHKISQVAFDRLKISFDDLTIELESLKEQHQSSLVQTTEAHAAVQQEMEGKLAELQFQLDDQSRELEIATQECTQAARRLEDEIEGRNAEKELHQKGIDAAQSKHKDAESTLVQLQEQIDFIQAQLQQSTEEHGKLQEEKLSLQEQITTLEAEVQKSISLKRYLESQLKESEDNVISVTEDLEQARTDLARSEKAANAAEVNLSLQGAQHKREMSELNQQLTALQSQPNLQSALVELEERNDEMEELLRKKCAEIEENDDRALEMLKENKKLTTKVEALTRKMQNLQTKLTAAKASMPMLLETLQADTVSQSSVQTSSSDSRIADRPRSVTTTNIPSSSSSSSIVPPVPSLPAFLVSAPPESYAMSPASRPPLHRAVSGPSSLARPKTPERPATHPPVFKVQTPERRTASSPPPEASFSIGKKRRAPDDFEESLPPQAFTVDSLPSQEHINTTTTPRARRMLSGLQSGFTPVRNNTRPTVTMPSPKRLMTTRSGVRSSPVIADVTNSPRGQASKTKRSWLGKIRGASSSQATSRSTDSKAGAKE
ncbi:hypothetical protein C0991_007594 [Blastosporella zonata]|nr:hypothetical protein C0991_007594 [Blastosporella zonata]